MSDEFDLNDLVKRAEGGDLNAQNSLGFHYESGVHVNRDESLAHQWYERAARRGYPVAQYNLALGYEQGRAGRRDDVEAARWYTKAARAGYPQAQHNLAQLYRRGRGVKRDIYEALKWYMRALRQDNLDAHLSLARLYEYGQHVERNLALAWELYHAVRERDERAVEGVERVEDEPDFSAERERVRERLLRRRDSTTRLELLMSDQPELRRHMRRSRGGVALKALMGALTIASLLWVYSAPSPTLSSDQLAELERVKAQLHTEQEAAITLAREQAEERMRAAQSRELQAEVQRLKQLSDAQLADEIQRIKRDTRSQYTSQSSALHATHTSEAEQRHEMLLYVLGLTIAFFLERIFEKLFDNKGYAILLVCLCGAIAAYALASYSLMGVLISGSLIGSKAS